MIILPGYQIVEPLYESSNSRLYKGWREHDNLPVVVKILQSDYLNEQQLAHLQNEYEFTRNLNLSGVRKALELTELDQKPALLLEYVPGQTLKEISQHQRLGVTDFLKIASQIAETLGTLHQQNIIHKDINTHNILFEPGRQQTKIIDFGISTQMCLKCYNLGHPNRLEGTLAYISPEQTGRMNRVVDHRTDLYSLGITFYEILTGRLPFTFEDPLELVHAHLAKIPLPPHHFRPDIPEIVSRIILKLLAKNAEDRYQSAFGLKYDLDRCLEAGQKLRELSFELGQRDFSGRFHLPQKLYGREAELEVLLAAFERVARRRKPERQAEDGENRPGVEIMLVSGYAGVGKSVLVHEIHKPITEKKGYFIEGKFDQFQRNIPYYAWTQAFKGWVNLLLTESEASQARWKDKILAVAGDIGQILVELIPNLALIIGPQPPVPELGGLEAQNRFNYLFQNFIRALAQPEHPLVIFIDDWQWADPASLNLLKLLAHDPQLQSLLLIGAYRDNEISPSHPFSLALEAVRQAGEVLNIIQVHNLAPEHVQALVADTLANGSQAGNGNDFQALAQLVYDKTLGNAFFVNEFLKSLDAEGLLQFNFGTLQWEYDLSQITGLNITDNVVELLAGKVLKLPRPTQTCLKLAACIGNEFDNITLGVIAEDDPQAIKLDLSQALREGLIYEEASGAYKFTHDRVQQAAYSLIPDQDKQQVHLKIGQLLLQNISPEQREERIFEIVNQLNLSLGLLTREAEKIHLAGLNLVAGKRAKIAAAYQPALGYLQTGLNLLPPQSWQTDYDLTLALYTEAAEMAYLTTNYELMETLTETILQQAVTILDKVKAYQIRIATKAGQNQGPEAFGIASEALQQLIGWTVPATPEPADIQRGLKETMASLSGKSLEELLNLPPMTDLYSQAAMNIIMSIGALAYRMSPRLSPLLAFKMIQLSLTYGNAPGSTYGYAAYGFILSSLVQDITNGYQFAQLGLHLVERLQARAYECNVKTLAYALVLHWQDPARSSLEALLEAHQTGLETGDMEYAAATIPYYASHAYFTGMELGRLVRKVQPYIEFLRQTKQLSWLNRSSICLQAALNLMGGTAQPSRLVGSAYDEEKILTDPLAVKDITALCHLYTNKLVLNFLFEDYKQAQVEAARAAQYLSGISGQLLLTVFHFYESLILLANFPTASEEEGEAILAKVAENQQKLRRWADHAPANNLHKFYLVEAERYRVLNEPKEAREYYDLGLRAAKVQAYPNEEGLAAELAGRFYLAREDTFLGEAYLRRAHGAYQRWGALTKVRQLETKYSHFLRPVFNQARLATVSTTGSGDTTAQFLDIHTILKASQAMAGEVNLSQLLAKMIKIVAENAGAEEGYLLLEKERTWYIEADYHAQEQLVHVLQSIPLEGETGHHHIPAEIIHYVVTAREPVVLNYASQEGPFSHLPYFKEKQSQSVLCLPLLHQSKLAGILYLENNLTPGAFSPERVELLNLLVSQMAISIENARLYTDLQQSEKKYRTIFEDSRDLIFITTPTGDIVDASPACFDLLGYTREEFLQMNAQDTYARAIDRLRFRQEVEMYGAVKDLEIRLRRRDGVEIDCLMTATLWKAEDGTVLGYQGIVRDITAQKRSEQERVRFSAVERELSLAKNIQQSLLPPPNPGWPDLEVVCYSMSAREVGGDLYAYYTSIPLFSRGAEWSSERKYIVAVGDVTSKGMPAALLMAVSLASLGSTVRQGLPPRQLLAQLDITLVDYTRESRQNCALVYAEIIPPALEAPPQETAYLVRMANAGCPAPLIKRRDGLVAWVDVGGLPLGLGLGAETGYSEVELSLTKGEFLILISDGIIEARNAEGELYGFERLEAAVAAGPMVSAEAMLQHLKIEVEAFVGSTEPHDDLTMVVVQV